jgi:SAM-dependent methyltransferase
MSGANLNDPAVAADYDLVYTNWDAQAERLVTVMNGHLPVMPGGHLLDASCGSGLAIDAARRLGWTVTGADASPAMLQRARSRFSDVDFRAAGLTSLAGSFSARFDAVISVGNALPMLDAARRAIALAQMRACLHEHGSLMVAVRDFSERAKSGVWRDDPVARVQARFAYRGGDVVIYALDVEDAAGSRTHELELHAVSPLELEAAVLEAGFRVTRSSRLQGRAVIAAEAV